MFFKFTLLNTIKRTKIYNIPMTKQQWSGQFFLTISVHLHFNKVISRIIVIRSTCEINSIVFPREECSGRTQPCQICVSRIMTISDWCKLWNQYELFSQYRNFKERLTTNGARPRPNADPPANAPQSTRRGIAPPKTANNLHSTRAGVQALLGDSWRSSGRVVSE